MTGKSCLQAVNRALNNFENLYIHCIAPTIQRHGFFNAMKAMAFLDLQEIKIKVDSIQLCMHMTWEQKGDCLGEPGGQKGRGRSLGVETCSKLRYIPI